MLPISESEMLVVQVASGRRRREHDKTWKMFVAVKFSWFAFSARQMNFSLIAEYSDTIYDGKR